MIRRLVYMDVRILQGGWNMLQIAIIGDIFDRSGIWSQLYHTETIGNLDFGLFKMVMKCDVDI